MNEQFRDDRDSRMTGVCLLCEEGEGRDLLALLKTMALAALLASLLVSAAAANSAAVAPTAKLKTFGVALTSLLTPPRPTPA